MPLLSPNYCQHVLQIYAVLAGVVLPLVLQIIRTYYIKEAYHTSILSGKAWVQESLDGHPERIWNELGVHKNVFHDLIKDLRAMGHRDSKYVTLEEQIGIFLYTCTTGLTIRHVGERFQRSNETVSR